MRSQVRFLLAPPLPPRPFGLGAAPQKEVSVKFIRQVLLAISIAGMVAGVLRRRTKGVVAPQQGGWREVTPQR